MLEDTIVGFYHRWARRKLPRGAVANRYLIFDLFSPNPRTNVSYRVYSLSEQAYVDYFVQETFPRENLLRGKIPVEKESENGIFKSAKEICTGVGCTVLCSRWSERDVVKARCFIQDKSYDYSYRLVVNNLQYASEAQETICAVRKILDDFLGNEENRIKRCSG